MAELKPCGTHAAYQRHRKRGESPCTACKDAEAAYVRERAKAKRQSSGESRLAAVQDLPALPDPPEAAPDPLATARDSLVLVEAALRSPMTPASSVASLTRRREELVDRIVKLSKPKLEEVSAVDRFAARRAARIAKTQA